MNRRLSRTILGLLVLVVSGIVTGGAAPPPGTTQAFELPVQCLLEKNVGSCVTCCMEASDAPAWACSHFCKAPPPPLPGGEPQP
jgi:hypothetical protein